MLNRARASAQQLKQEVENYSEIERTYFSRRSAREQLRTRVELLRRQVAEQEAMEEEGRLGRRRGGGWGEAGEGDRGRGGIGEGDRGG